MHGGRSVAYLGYGFCCLSEIGTPLSTRLGEEILNKAHTDVVSHLVQLLVNFRIVAVIITTELGNDRAIGKCDELSVNLVNSIPRSPSSQALPATKLCSSTST